MHSFFNTAVFFNFIDQHLHFCLHSSVFLLHRCKFLCNTLEKSIDRLHVISAENCFFKADFLYFLHRHMFFLRLYIICRTDTEKWSGCARPKSAPFVRQAQSIYTICSKTIRTKKASINAKSNGQFRSALTRLSRLRKG